jgi:predicted phosphatase
MSLLPSKEDSVYEDTRRRVMQNIWFCGGIKQYMTLWIDLSGSQRT